MSEPATEIQAALEQLTTEVTAGHGTLRLAALATVAGHEPQVRHVIIRRFTTTPLSLVFFCRADDAKFGEIASNPAVELVCYARQPDRQIRLAGTAVNMTNATELDRLWSQVSPAARRDYSLAPDGEDGIGLATSNRRVPLFRAIAVAIRRAKILTFEQGCWIERSYSTHSSHDLNREETVVGNRLS